MQDCVCTVCVHVFFLVVQSYVKHTAHSTARDAQVHALRCLTTRCILKGTTVRGEQRLNTIPLLVQEQVALHVFWDASRAADQASTSASLVKTVTVSKLACLGLPIAMSARPTQIVPWGCTVTCRSWLVRSGHAGLAQPIASSATQMEVRLRSLKHTSNISHLLLFHASRSHNTTIAKLCHASPYPQVAKTCLCSP
jgi:hypothetical protein